jgi:glucosyl-dolichyl phosphate glucuronosyltransferase
MISVIIPTRNRASQLADSLESICKNSIPTAYEVLVVDNGSSDNTRDVAIKFKNKIPDLQYFYESTPGLHAGRHRGMMESKYNLLTFVDDDIIATKTWLEGILESFMDENVVLVGGNNYPLFKGEVPDWLVLMWNHRKCSYGKAIPSLSILDFGMTVRSISPIYVWGCNFSIRKDILFKAGGFHPDGMPEAMIDYRGDGETYVSEYILENKMKCIFNPKASVYHTVSGSRMTLSYFKKRAFMQGISDSFTDLRKHHLDYSQHESKRYDVLFKKIIRNIFTHKNITLSNIKLNKILHEMKLSRNEGYDYHKRLFLRNERIRSWVLKENYL